MGSDGQAALRTTDREELIFLLSEACELEHGLCCCYLFAAFSLKRRLDEGLTATELEAVTRWEHTITHVAVQEMLHLAMAGNLLTALGAAPNLHRPNFPLPTKYYPSLQMSLRRFDEMTLDHFIFIERPEGMDMRDAPAFATAAASAPVATNNVLEPEEVPFSSVAVLYRDIEAGFKDLCSRLGEERVFIGPVRAQVTSEYLPFPGITPITNLASALKVIELIVEQGEGLRGDIEDSHYARFLAIRGELDRLKSERPGFEPAREVMDNPFTAAPPDAAGVNLIDNPDACAISDLFNASYGLTVEILMRFFAHTEETDEELRALVATAIGGMRGVIKPLGAMLTSLPATTAGDTPRAGPSFAFDRSIDYLPHRDPAWAVFDERFIELAEFSAELASRDTKGLGLDRVRDTIEALGAGLRKHRPNAVTGVARPEK